jgi:uridine kinase
LLLQWDLNNKDLHKKYVEICDDDFELYFSNIVQNILTFTKVKVLTVSGPTSSGKTTTALKLISELKKFNVNAKIISMDDFYINNDVTPKKPDGTPDFETIDALDTDLLIKCLNEAISYNKTRLPKFSFKTGRRKSDMIDFELGANEIIIMEGMHGLNPKILDYLPGENGISIYTTIGEKVFLPDDIIFSKRDIRLLRRLIRDYKYRGASPEYTFKLWDGVREGEDLYIFPYENNAHIKINSFYKYELNVIKSQALELLAEFEESSNYYKKAQELMQKLTYVIAIDEEHVPDRSLIREFIGGNSLYYI